ncbi:MAG: succinylglutamate desuccinylase/aspartoacylase family protein [Bdellovibrionales bacterium]|nr:succinylglutamate desuccinylase/aspartoacylase family protein [Bdellovibrionales bacterium]NQZ19091.1 succinylglutamate desuccinylase/aspartoacylase family protein [Bdellovibrionales bacterium]
MAYQRAYTFGKTANGLAIPAYKFGNSGPSVLIVAGVHGDEIEGIQAANGLLQSFSESFPYKLNLTLIPNLNVDGTLANSRQNARKVDLNRNLPTQDWTSEVAKPRYNPGPAAMSEPENVALVEHLQKDTPKFIFTLHSWKPMLNVNGDCAKVASVISERTGYIITEDIGYPTPGSLGTYAGLERQIPTITYEFARPMDVRDILEKHVPAIKEGLKVLEA